MNRQLVPLAGLLLALGAGCSRGHAAVEGPRLAPTDPLPSTFAPNTKLALGDPLVEKQLALSGQLASLPFAVDWHNVTGGPGTLEAFRGRALDGGAVGDTPPIHAALTGLDVKIIAVQLRTTPTTSFALAPGANVHKLEDLKGKRIAYSPGQAQGALVLRVLKKLGWMTSDVQLIELTGTEFKEALSSRQVDMAPLSGPALKRYLNGYAKQGASMIAHGVRDTLNFYYVRSEVLEDPNKAAALREYVKIRTQAQLWARQHREQWLDAYYVKDQGLTVEDAHWVTDAIGEPIYPADWTDAIALTQETIDLVCDAAGFARFDAAKLFDRRFERIAAEVASSLASNQPLHRTSGTQ